jgi:predicted nuclease with RNAse H fold
VSTFALRKGAAGEREIGRRGWPFVGIDLTEGRRPSDIAALDPGARRATFARALTDDDLLRALGKLEAQMVAIDSPMGLPAGLCCLEESCGCEPSRPGTGRSAERELARLGISCFWTTKRSIIKGMVYRAIALKARLEGEGYVVLEVFPYAVKRILLGRPLPKKTSPEGVARLVRGLSDLLPRCRWPAGWTPDHDQLDALFCAVTARLYSLGETESLGDEDEVPLIIPLAVSRQPLGHQPSAYC